MILVLHLSSRWNNFLISLSISIQFFFTWVAGCHLIIWDVSHKTISSFFFSCWFSNNSVLAFVVSVLSQDLVSLRSLHSILTFVPEALWCSSFQPIISFCQRSCSFHAYPLNRSVVPFCSSSFRLIKSCITSQPECFSKLFFLVPLV